jgi:phage shock protein PspC (stress-responsive transcriptional regulator)
MDERLTRDLEHAMLGGVIAGMARYWRLDVTLLRLIALVLIPFTGGMVVIVYLAAWVIVPRPDQVSSSPPGEGEGRRLRDRLDRQHVTEFAREAGDTARRAADRMSEAARLAQEAARTAADAARAAADAARTAAEEISDIAHPPRPFDAREATPRPAPQPAEVPDSEEAPPPSDFTGADAADGVDPAEGRPSDQLAAEEQPATEADRERESSA